MVNDYPDASLAFCDGGDPFFGPPPPYDQILAPVIPCYFHSFGNRVHDNSFAGNGSFGNPTNGDLANAVIDFKARNCFFDNEAEEDGALKTAPARLQSPAVAGTATIAYTGDCTNAGNTCQATATFSGNGNFLSSSASTSIVIKLPVATSGEQCKKGGWQFVTDDLGNLFKNQGDCVSYVATNGRNKGAGGTP